MTRASPPPANVLAIDAHPEFSPLPRSGETEQQCYRREMANLCRQFIRIGTAEELEVVRRLMAYRVTHDGFQITAGSRAATRRALSQRISRPSA